MENPESRIRFEHIDVENSDEVISFVKRNFNILQETNIIEKKNAIKTIHDFLEASKQEINSSLIELILNTFLKNILKALADPLEKIRESALKILNFLLSRCEDISRHLPYIISVLIERMNCEDLEGIANLPEVMRPMPSQKPHVHVRLVETVEEIRMEYNELLNTIISCTNEDEIRDHINDMVHILRAIVMDPCSDVQIGACKNISLFCKTFRELLFHFSEILARALLLPLVNKKSKVRIAALEALGQVLYCGCWKYNANIFEFLIGFRDPNVVPIKDFFEYSTRINYMAILNKDPKTAVREAFIRYLGDWLLILPDRYDHETRLVPYLISGLFDPDEEIRKSVVEIIEEIGLQYEKEKEKDFREIKQFGYDSEWAKDGKTISIAYPDPLKTRPRIGSRYFVRAHVRKFLNALYREVKDLDYENRLRSANLLLYCVIYSEEYITQHLNKFLVQMLLNFRIRDKEDVKVYDKIGQAFHYIGIFCPPDGYIPLIRSGIKGDLADHEFIPKYTLHSMYYLLSGCFEVCNKEVGIDHKKKFIYEVIDVIGNDEFLGSLDLDSVNVLENILECILRNMIEKAPAEELENFYTTKKYKLEIIFYTIIGFKLSEFNSSASKLDLEESYIPKLDEFFAKNNDIMSCFEKLDQIYEDLMLDNFIETFIKSVTENYLSLVQWKIVYALIMTSIVRRSKSPDFYHDTLRKTLSFLRTLDMSTYSKAYEILSINIMITKLLGDSFNNSELTEAHSIIFFDLIEILHKTYGTAEKNATKIQELRDKMLSLSKIILCRDLNWQNCLKNIGDHSKQMYGNIADLIQVILNSLQSSEKNLKELKIKLKTFNKIMLHVVPLTTTKPEYMETSEKKYIIPQIAEFLLNLHERFFNIDEEGLLPDLFEGVFTLLRAQKDVQEEDYNGDDYIIPKYNDFIDRIIVLNLDTKDSANKEKYKALIKVIARKNPFNILKLWEKAMKTHSVARMELLDSIRNDLLV